MLEAPKVKMPFFQYIKLAKNDPIRLRTMIFSEYGDIAQRKVKGVNNYYLAHPDFVKHILQDNQDNYLYRHPLAQQAFGPAIGMNSLFLTNDLEQWYRDRITSNISFDPKVYFHDYAKTITDLTDEMLNRWQKSYRHNEHINIANEFDPLVISIIANTLFTRINFDFDSLAKNILNLADCIKIKLTSLPFIWPFTSTNDTYQNLLNVTKTLTENFVSARLNSNEHYDDLLGYLIKEHQHLPHNQIIKLVGFHLATFFAVGYFTTSALIQWIMVELSYYPDVEKKIEDELNTVLSGRPPTFQDLTSLRYLSSVIKETLRLRPTSFAFLRRAISDDNLCGYRMPKDSGVIVSIYHLHRHPDFWANPEAFDPDRFLENPLGQGHPFAYVPFAGGKRRCIGSSFSTLEATLIVATFVQRFRLCLLPFTEVKPRFTSIITMRPDVKMMRLQFK